MNHVASHGAPPATLTLIRSVCAAEGPGVWGLLLSSEKLAQGIAQLTSDGHQVIAQDEVAFVKVVEDDVEPLAVYRSAEGNLEVSTHFECGYACGLLEWTLAGAEPLELVPHHRARVDAERCRRVVTALAAKKSSGQST